MSEARVPKIIKISRGDHSLSPHLTSLKSDELQLNKDQNTSVHEHHRAPYEAVTTPFELNLILPEPSMREALRERVAHFEKQKITAVPAKKIEKKKPVQQKSQKKQSKQSVNPSYTQQSTTPHHKGLRLRATAAFIVLALAIVTPLKAITTYERLQEAKSNVENLKSTAHGGVGNNFDAVGGQITQALTTFHSANTTLNEINPVEEFVLRHTPVFGEQFGVATRLVGAGEHVSFAAASYMQLFRTLKERQDAPLIERLSMFFEGNRAVVSDLSAAADLVRPIDPQSLPENQQAFVAQARDAILALDNDAEYLASAGPLILSTLGGTQPRRYLIVFQNSTELRPTGGFIGSFALLDIEKGEVKNLQVPSGGSYDLQGSLKTHVFAPIPMHIINTRWEFQDGNWFPDFPTSAQKLMWFLEKSQGPSVDGVIAINSTLLPELLAVVGPVHLKDGTMLDSDTALTTMRETINTVNADIATKSKPKEIITAAAPAIIETLKSDKSEHFLPLITAVLKGLERREIQLYARDPSIQKQLADFGWDGALRENPDGDFLSVVATNIGGQKTDALINQTIDHQAKIADDGTVTVTVRISRAQRASSKALEDAPNISYIRVYAPTGSTLVHAQGFSTPSEKMFQAPDQWEQEDLDLQRVEHERGFDPQSGTRITDELGHTAFGNWMITTPGASTEAVVSYTLPFKVQPHESDLLGRVAEALYESSNATSYTVYIQRQSGASPTQISSRVILPEGWRMSWVTDNRAQIAENGVLLSLPFSTDLHYGLTATAYATDIKTAQK